MLTRTNTDVKRSSIVQNMLIRANHKAYSALHLKEQRLIMIKVTKFIKTLPLDLSAKKIARRNKMAETVVKIFTFIE